MANFKITVLLCIVGLVVPALSVTTKCYQCEYFEHEEASQTNVEECETNPPDKKYLIDCELENGNPNNDTIIWQCQKLTGRIEVEEENFSFIRRSCHPGPKLETVCKDTKSYHVGGEHFIKKGKNCICDGDGCNAASSVGMGIVTIAAGLFAVVLR